MLECHVLDIPDPFIRVHPIPKALMLQSGFELIIDIQLINAATIPQFRNSDTFPTQPASPEWSVESM